jgi:uncharacterized membrane protein HdeD (DUF308 family)
MAKRILVPLDNTTEHEAILPLVADMARGSGATVRLMHVAPVPASVVAGAGRVVAYADQEMDRLQHEWIVSLGLVAIVAAFRAAERLAQGWPLLVEGGVSVILGVFAWVFPMIPLPLLYLIASWGIITGVLAIVAAMGLSLEQSGRWLLGLAGASSILLGMLLMVLPGSGVIVVVRMVGIYALVFGVLVLLLSVRLRGWRGTLVHATP